VKGLSGEAGGSTGVEAELKAEKEKLPKEVEAPREEIEVVEEKFIALNFRRAWITPRKKRSARVLRMLRERVKRVMKVEDVKISGEVNEMVWSGGAQKPPRKLEVRAVRDKDGNVIVFPKA
jgi:large subunit ribosomal protein L31e